MTPIKFYRSEEIGIVKETGDLSQSIFSEQYCKAKSLIVEKLHTNVDNVPNIIAFCGDRGEGKTSCMTTIINKLIEDSDWLGGGLNNHFQFLKTIDPAFFDDEHNVIQLMLGQMFVNFKKEYEDEEEPTEEKRAKIEELEFLFQKAKACLSQLKQPRERIYDPLEDLDSLAAAEELQESLNNLIKGYIRYYHKGDVKEASKDKLIISIDDIDLNIDGAYIMAEQIRKYLVCKDCIVFVSLNIDQLIDVIANYIQKKSILENRESSLEMATKYVNKLIPMGCRIVMPKIYDLCDRTLEVYKDRCTEEHTKYNSVKEAIVQLIYNKSRYLFYNSKGGISPIVPNNLRSLRHLLGMLLDLEDFVDNPTSESNKHVFKSYFYQNWIHQLKKEDQHFVNALTSSDVNMTNKMVLSYLAKYIPDSAKEKGTLISDILFSGNYCYNVSVGDVFYVISFLERSNVDNNLRLSLFFIKSFYSIRLYDLYDVITEQEGEMFPETKTDGEVYRSDALFNKTNILQRFVNGAYFTYEPDDLLPKTADGSMNRDMKVFNAMLLTSEISKTLKEEMQRYDQMSEDDKKSFQLRFRITEFYALTAKRAISRRKAEQYDRMRRDYSEAFHLSDFNLGTGYLVFDVTAPFYNIINLKYTYNRFAYLRGKVDNYDQFYKFALKQPWSLLRSMIDYVRMKSYNEENPDDPKPIGFFKMTAVLDKNRVLRELASNAIIRNGDVLSSLSEKMQSRRANMHNVKDSRKLLIQFYNDIINSDMRTYRNISTEKPYYIRFSFLEALIDLLKEETEDSLLAKIYESGIDSTKTTDDDVLVTFKKFFDITFKSKRRSAIILEFKRRYSEFSDRLVPSDWESMFPDPQKSYSREDIISTFRSNFVKMTGKAKASDVYVDDEEDIL